MFQICDLSRFLHVMQKENIFHVPFLAVSQMGEVIQSSTEPGSGQNCRLSMGLHRNMGTVNSDSFSISSELRQESKQTFTFLPTYCTIRIILFWRFFLERAKRWTSDPKIHSTVQRSKKSIGKMWEMCQKGSRKGQKRVQNGSRRSPEGVQKESRKGPERVKKVSRKNSWKVQNHFKIR